MISHRSSLPTGDAATAVSQPEAVPSGTDAAAPLDLLLADGARGLLRRFAPTGPGLRWGVALAHRPETVVQRLRDLSGELGEIAIGRTAGAPDERDRRFRDDAWRTNPMLRRILQAYLAAGGTVRALLADAHLDWRDRARGERGHGPAAIISPSWPEFRSLVMGVAATPAS